MSENRYEFRLPDVGEGLHEAEIGQWLVQEGDWVEQDQPMVEIETDKATVEIPAPVAGRIAKILAPTGTIAQVGDPLVVIEMKAGVARPGGPTPRPAEAPSSTAEAPAPSRILASPLARKKAAELGVDLSQLQGTGPGGRIMVADVEQATQRGPAPAPAPPPPTPAPVPDGRRVRAAPAVRRRAAELGIDLAQVPGSAEGGRITMEDLERYAAAREAAPPETAPTPTPAPPPPPAPAPAQEVTETVPLRGVRRRIAQRMEEAWRIPQVTTFDQVDARGLVRLREALKPVAEAQGVRLTFLPLIVKIVVQVLREFPNFNASLDMEQEVIHRYGHIHMGVATQTPAGLVVPVIRHADRLSVLEIAREMERLASGARERSLGPQELSGSTFTITNFGSFGGDLGTPIINPPEAAILGVGRIARRPVVNQEGELEVRWVAPLALTFDHRLNDGADAGAFIRRVGELFARPEILFLELR